MGDNSIQEAIGKGCIDISMTIKKNVLPRMLTNILHVPKIVKNIFSFNKATSYGHIFKFGNKRVHNQKYAQRGSKIGHAGKSTL
jgi:hypothetical protein